MLYNLSILLYQSAIKLASLWNPKARLWVEGRQHWRTRYRTLLDNAAGKKRVWIHCASLGEFEQGRPVLEEIRSCYPNSFIVLSFFSPSGFEIRKHYNQADAVIYLPADTPANARDFLDIIRPDLAIFVKYEYWLNYLEEMGRRDIPVLMISAIFRPGQVFFKWYGGKWKKVLHSIRMFFVQEPESGRLLEQAGISHYVTSGDTRFDRVLAVKKSFNPVDIVERFCENAPVIVAGSTWEEDEEAWRHYANAHRGTKFIIAPHEIYEARIKTAEKLFSNTVRYAQLVNGPANDQAHLLIVDNIGLLSKLYHYGDICYVGGGFGNGIHNILEAAVYGKPIVFGPEFEKFKEARDLIELGAAFSINSALELEEIVTKLMGDPKLREKAADIARAYVQEKSGATGTILEFIQEKRLLTN